MFGWKVPCGDCYGKERIILMVLPRVNEHYQHVMHVAAPLATRTQHTLLLPSLAAPLPAVLRVSRVLNTNFVFLLLPFSTDPLFEV